MRRIPHGGVGGHRAVMAKPPPLNPTPVSPGPFDRAAEPPGVPLDRLGWRPSSCRLGDLSPDPSMLVWGIFVGFRRDTLKLFSVSPPTLAV